MRADAARNRRRVLEAARALVARDGAEVRMDDLAAEAGVAVGTLYRHFATKEALVAAVVEDSVVTFAERAERAAADVAAGEDAWTHLESLLRDLAAHFEEDQAAKAAAARLGAQVHVDVAEPGTAAARAGAAAEQVLDRARATGQVRDDVTIEDLLVLLQQVPADGTAGGASGGPSPRERYLRVVLRGLRP